MARTKETARKQVSELPPHLAHRAITEGVSDEEFLKLQTEHMSSKPKPKAKRRSAKRGRLSVRDCKARGNDLRKHRWTINNKGHFAVYQEVDEINPTQIINEKISAINSQASAAKKTKKSVIVVNNTYMVMRNMFYYAGNCYRVGSPDFHKEEVSTTKLLCKVYFCCCLAYLFI